MTARTPYQPRTALTRLPFLLGAALLGPMVAAQPAPCPPALARDSLPIDCFDGPVLVGGLAHLIERVAYPAEAIRSRQGGRVVVRMVTDTTGAPTDVRIARGVSPELDAEAVRVVLQHARFEPVCENGRHVEQNVVLPIAFRRR